MGASIFLFGYVILAIISIYSLVIKHIITFQTKAPYKPSNINLRESLFLKEDQSQLKTIMLNTTSMAF